MERKQTNRCQENKTLVNKRCSLDDIRENTRIISTISESRCLVDRLVEDYQLVALDVKGHNMGRGGPISLLTLATTDGHCFLFDLRSNQQLMVEGKVKYLLEYENIVKVIHDSKAFTQAITSCYNVQTKNIFDVQVGHAIIQSRKKNISPCEVEDACLCYISEVYGRGLDTSAGSVLRRINAEHPNFWDIRPIFCKAAEFAARQVMCLVPEVYDNMNVLIPFESHMQFMQMVENKVSPQHKSLQEDDLISEKSSKTFLWLQNIKNKINTVIDGEINKNYRKPKSSTTINQSSKPRHFVRNNCMHDNLTQKQQITTCQNVKDKDDSRSQIQPCRKISQRFNNNHPHPQINTYGSPPRLTDKRMLTSQAIRPRATKRTCSPFVLVCRTKIPCRQCCDILYHKSLKPKLNNDNRPTWRTPLLRKPDSIPSAKIIKSMIISRNVKTPCPPQTCPSILPSLSTSQQKLSTPVTKAPNQTQNSPQKDCIGYIGVKAFDMCKEDNSGAEVNTCDELNRREDNFSFENSEQDEYSDY